MSDLLDASFNCQSQRAVQLKDTAAVLRTEMRSFHDRLEELRERLEDTSRCFDLLARCQCGPTEDKDSIELARLAEKSGNERLVEQCQVSAVFH